jgi:hypothetical protein
MLRSTSAPSNGWIGSRFTISSHALIQTVNWATIGPSDFDATKLGVSGENRCSKLSSPVAAKTHAAATVITK